MTEILMICEKEVDCREALIRKITLERERHPNSDGDTDTTKFYISLWSYEPGIDQGIVHSFIAIFKLKRDLIVISKEINK
jgi:hypothetical protein